ncbi:hypothetical protein PFWH6_3847 [Pseudomonas fluorescens WH6]|nr:hypothetical protein PFWH6_3847 [Pseudomonas fluorescens WH6]
MAIGFTQVDKNVRVICAGNEFEFQVDVGQPFTGGFLIACTWGESRSWSKT